MINKIKRITIFDFVVYAILIIVSLLCLLPILYVLAKSFSGEGPVTSGRVGLWPVEFQTGTYRYVLSQRIFWNSFLNTLKLTFLGTLFNLVATSLTAYPLSRLHLRGRKFIIMIFIFGWIFVPPLVPMYLVMKNYGLINTYRGLILMDLVIAYNMLIVKTFFEELPESMIEAAKIDGAGEFRLYWQIALPLSVPCLVTVGMFIAFYYWNMYVPPRIYINSQSLQTMQMYLYDLIMNSMQQGSESGEMVNMYGNVLPDTIRSTTVILSIIPILCVYPFMQKYFVKGMTLGSVKG